MKMVFAKMVTSALLAMYPLAKARPQPHGISTFRFELAFGRLNKLLNEHEESGAKIEIDERKLV